jgi:hypothetical protein
VSAAKYKIPSGKRVQLSDDLEREIKDRFQQDRENRFQLFVLSSGIRNKYLDKRTKTYSKEFIRWYRDRGLEEIFGKLPNFTKYANCGDVIAYVASKTSDPDKYLKKLPTSVGALYEISLILKSSEDLFRVCLHYTAKRKALDTPPHEWVTKLPALINQNASELAIRSWRRKWENPPAPKVKRSDKRTLPFVTITCSGELLDFDKRTGEKIGALDLDEVELFYEKLTKFFKKEATGDLQFRLNDDMDYLTRAYFKRKESNDPARNLIGETKKKSQKYT